LWGIEKAVERGGQTGLGVGAGDLRLAVQIAAQLGGERGDIDPYLLKDGFDDGVILLEQGERQMFNGDFGMPGLVGLHGGSLNRFLSFKCKFA
jgi:hypothetical protein